MNTEEEVLHAGSVVSLVCVRSMLKQGESRGAFVKAAYDIWQESAGICIIIIILFIVHTSEGCSRQQRSASGFPHLLIQT